MDILKQDILKREMEIKAIIQDLRDSGDSYDSIRILNSQANENLKSMRFAIDELELFVQELDKDSERNILLKEINNYKDLLRKKKMDLRAANNACNKHLAVKERDDLLKFTSTKEDSSNVIRRRADKESLTKKSSAITDQLAGVRNVIANQVKMSEETLHTLVGSSSIVRETGEELKLMGGIINTSKTLLRKYGRREVTTQVLQALAFLFFFTCVFYVVQKRLF